MKEVNILVGRFQPFTNGHLACCELAYKKKGIPTVLCVVESKTQDSRHPFSMNIMKNYLDDLVRSCPCIEDYVVVRNANIVDIAPVVQEAGYEPISWTCGTDRYASYTKMVRNYWEKAGISKDFEVLEIKRGDEDISATKARQALYAGDRYSFSSIVPKAVAKYYNTLRTEVMVPEGLYNYIKNMLDNGYSQQ